MSYWVTIRREERQSGSDYIARDDQGNQRAWWEANAAELALGHRVWDEIAESLFHKEEIGTVQKRSNSVRVEILTD